MYVPCPAEDIRQSAEIYKKLILTEERGNP